MKSTATKFSQHNHNPALHATSRQFRARFRPASSMAALANILFALALLLAARPPGTMAQPTPNPPDRMTYQGYLTDGNGAALGLSAPKNYDVIFRVWNDQNSTDVSHRLWAEQQTVTVDKGYFSVLLGEGSQYSTEPYFSVASLFAASDASDRYVEITVKGIGAGGSDVTIQPRLRLLTSPYSFLAQKAVNAVSLVNNSNVAIVSASGTTLTINGSVNANTVSASSLSADNYSGNFTLNGNIYMANGQTLVAKNNSGNNETFLWPRWLDNASYLNYGTGGFYIRNNGNSPKLYFNDAGNIGIGTTTPGFPLTFPSSLGDKISLWGQSGNSFGFGIQPALLQIHADVANSDIAFGYGSSASMTERMRIKGNGNVGIGTSTPSSKLQVVGDVTVNNGTLKLDNHQALYAKNASGNYEAFLFPRWSSDATYLIYGTGGFGFQRQNSGTTMWIHSDGNVGIGTTSPTQAKLVVSGGPTGNLGAGSYLDFQGEHVGTLNGQTVSIYTTGVIWSGSYSGASSDERIKNIEGLSDGEKDLQTLAGIQITDYHFKDRIALGDTPQKKVIGQQVEKVFPQAVSKHTQVVPDIYQKAPIKDGWVTLATDLKKGERVKLISDKAEGVYEVLEATADKFLTDCKPEGDKVFVYGREVSDFRVVDYDAISMLNVSATQELYRNLKSQANELAGLKQALAEKSTKVDQLEKEVSGLRQQLALQASSRDELLARIEARDQRLDTIEKFLRSQQAKSVGIETSYLSDGK